MTERPVQRFRRRWADVRPFLEASKGRIVVISVASILAGFLEAVSLVLLVQTALAISSGDGVADLSLGPFGGDREASVATLITVTVVVTLLRFGMQIVSAYLPARMSSDAQARLRTEIFDAWLHSSWDLQSREREGRLVEVVLGQVNRSTVAVMILADGMTAGFNFLALMASALFLNPIVALSIFVSVTVLFFVLRPLTARARTIGAQRSAGYLDITESVTEAARMIEEVQVFDVVASQRLIVEQQTERVRHHVYRAQYLSRALTALYQAAALLLVLGGLALVYAVGAGDVGTLGAIVLIMVRGLTYSQNLQATYHRLNDTAPDMVLVRRSLERYHANRRETGGRRLPPALSLEFRNVSFEYRKDVPVLREVSFAIEPGEALGIIGPSGAGKSTIVQLLLRLRTPTAGEFLLDGLPAEEYSLTEWREAFAYVPQDGRLIRGTVADNIRFYREFDSEDVVHAAELAGLHSDIASWPRGYDTMVSQRADALSGGQRQRLTIARALVGRPSFLILDEPTSALDLRSEAVIQETLEKLKGQVTIVIIAHRLSTLASCDRLLVFEDGVLQASGAPEELHRSNEFYRRAVELSQLA